jgi:hypothetical protein
MIKFTCKNIKIMIYHIDYEEYTDKKRKVKNLNHQKRNLMVISDYSWAEIIRIKSKRKKHKINYLSNKHLP